MNNKNLILIIIILLLGVGTYFLTTNPSLKTEEAATDSMEEHSNGEAMEEADTMEEEAMEAKMAPEDAFTFTLTEDSMAMYVAQKRFLQREDAEVIGTSTGVTGEGWISPDGTEMQLDADIDLSLLSTDAAQRDTDVQGLLSVKVASISFDETGVQNPILLGGAFNSPILAIVSINGIENPVEFTVTGTVTEAEFAATGTAEILISDFGIAPPSLAGVFTVDDLVELRFDVVGAAGAETVN